MQTELRNAEALRSVYAAKLQALASDEAKPNGKTASRKVFIDWAADERTGPLATRLAEAPGNRANARAFIPFVKRLSASAGASPPRDSCVPTNREAFSKALEEQQACAGVVGAHLANEDYHIATCRKVGFVAYDNERTGAELAADAIAAYDAQITVLRTALDKLFEGATLTLSGVWDVEVLTPGFGSSLRHSFEPTTLAVKSGPRGTLTAKGQTTLKLEFLKLMASGKACTYTAGRVHETPLAIEFTSDLSTQSLSIVNTEPFGAHKTQCGNGRGVAADYFKTGEHIFSHPDEREPFRFATELVQIGQVPVVKSIRRVKFNLTCKAP